MKKGHFLSSRCLLSRHGGKIHIQKMISENRIKSAMESAKFYQGRWQRKYFLLERWEGERNPGRLPVSHSI